MVLIPLERLHYSEKYTDGAYEYRHVMVPKEFAKYIPKTHLMTETEWRNLGIAQSPGWEHYMLHDPEPHILMFRRKTTEEEKAAAASDGQENSAPIKVG